MGTFTALVALLIGTAAPMSVVIPTQFARVFHQEALKTRSSGIESFYCLQGYINGSNIKITGVIKPWQMTSQEYTRTRYQSADSTWTRTKTVSSVTYVPCPKGTIADLHTHPYGTTIPSEIDALTWNKVGYRVHIIIAETPDGRVIVSAWDRSGASLSLRSIP